MNILLEMPDNQAKKSSEKLTRLILVIEKLGFKNDSEFAKAIGMSKSYVSEILSSGHVPKTMGQKLEDKLKVSRKWFDLNDGDMMLADNNYKNAENEEYPLINESLASYNDPKDDLISELKAHVETQRNLIEILTEENKRLKALIEPKDPNKSNIAAG
ncbi:MULTISPECIES: helix-turn-helix domain-containing protein [Olivibacter]|uniref:Helix-turn-helix domain-containing protein n=1 Tax=Olivibacter jilunii TaxID=985016 RepID=A0ABW6B361_9SPHI